MTERVVKRCHLVVLFVLLVAPLPVTSTQAAPEAARRLYAVMGLVTCEQWNEGAQEQARAESKRATDPFTANLRSIGMGAELRWVLGYLSAINMAIDFGKDVLENVDSQIVRDWMDVYCQQNPTRGGDDAAWELYLKLAK